MHSSWLPILAVVWEEAYTSGLDVPPDVIIMPWKCGVEWFCDQRHLVHSSHQIIQATCFYLDDNAPWSHYSDRSITWHELDCEHNMTIDHVEVSFLGAQTSVWTEKIDEDILECRVWPRAGTLERYGEPCQNRFRLGHVYAFTL